MFKEFYFWMHTYLSKIKTNDLPGLNAYLLICILQAFNIDTFAVVVNYFLKINLNRQTAIYIGLGLAFILAVINRFLLYNKREAIFKEYEDSPSERKTKGQIYFWLYVILSCVIFYIAVANMVTPKY